MSTAIEKTSGLKAGDRVRLTAEGIVDEVEADGGLYVKLSGWPRSYYASEEVEAPTFKIERLSLAMGDRVTLAGGGLVRTIIAIHNGFAWLDNGGASCGGPITSPLASLRLYGA